MSVATAQIDTDTDVYEVLYWPPDSWYGAEELQERVRGFGIVEQALYLELLPELKRCEKETQEGVVPVRAASMAQGLALAISSRERRRLGPLHGELGRPKIPRWVPRRYPNVKKQARELLDDWKRDRRAGKA